MAEAKLAHNAAGAQLAEALQILSGTVKLPPRRRARTAALLARDALEAIVQARLVERDQGLSDASMRVKLICLRTLVDAQTGREAAWLYARLSHACHQHAYELAPNAFEIEDLVKGVQALARR